MQPTSAIFEIPALDCPEELSVIRKGLSRVEGVGELYPDYLNRRLRIEFDADRIDAGRVASSIQEIGFSAHWLTSANAAEGAGSQRRVAGVRWTTIVGGLLLLAAFAAEWTPAVPPAWSAALAILSAVTAGMSVARAAWRAVRVGALDMNALMTLAAIGAIVTGDYFEAATAMFLFGVSLWLESFSLARARRAVRSLLELTPQMAHRFEQGEVRDVAAASLQPGDRVLIKPGERLPVDGRVEQGESTVDQAPITGESLPVDKSPGDSVFAGTINGEGALEVTAERTGDQSTLAQIARLVDQAQQSRSPTERFVDRFARRYTPAVIALAIAIAVFPPLLAHFGVGWAGGYSAGQWLHRGLVLLVIACPCALVISTPVTIVCGLHFGARRGLLIKGGQFLERAGQVDCIAFDKTGTLTSGKLEVLAVISAADNSADEVLRVAAALESRSEHPVAQAIASAAKDKGLSWDEPEQVTALRGVGIEGRYGGQLFYVGSPRLFRERGLPGAPSDGQFPPELLAQWPSDLPQDTAAIFALVGSQERLLGGVLLVDRLRPHAAESLAQLRRSGVRRIAVLTGDRQTVAKDIAAKLGVDELHADLLPADKVAVVKHLAAQHPRLAMVGDGVNDAPALAAASIGIAFGSDASDTALETADVVVMFPQLYKIGELLQLGRRCRRILSQNIAIALAIKAAVLMLAVVGPENLAKLWLAVAADVGASLIVISNGMRLAGKGE